MRILALLLLEILSLILPLLSPRGVGGGVSILKHTVPQNLSISDTPIVRVSPNPTFPTTHSGSPPLVIRSSVLHVPNPDPSLPENPHSMVVDRVLSILDGDESDDDDSMDENGYQMGRRMICLMMWVQMSL